MQRHSLSHKCGGTHKAKAVPQRGKAAEPHKAKGGVLTKNGSGRHKAKGGAALGPCEQVDLEPEVAG